MPSAAVIQRVLIVEDEEDSANILKRMLKAQGIAAVVADTAEAALQVLADDTDGFDVGIIDLALPEMDGFELLHTLRTATNPSTMPLIAVTAFYTVELREQGLQAGFDGFFAKPVDIDELLRYLRGL